MENDIINNFFSIFKTFKKSDIIINDKLYIDFNFGGNNMKFPKKIVTGIIGIATTTTPLVSDMVSEKLRQKKEKIEQEKIYANQKHNGIVKIASILFSLIGIALSIIAIKQFKIILGIVGILAVISYVITFLYCLEILHENKHNIYKIVFIIGNMLMVIVATLLFF